MKIFRLYNTKANIVGRKIVAHCGLEPATFGFNALPTELPREMCGVTGVGFKRLLYSNMVFVTTGGICILQTHLLSLFSLQSIEPNSHADSLPPFMCLRKVNWNDAINMERCLCDVYREHHGGFGSCDN